MRRTPYTPCKLFYDGGQTLDVGHFLKTPGGSAYLIQKVRRNKNRSYRQHLDCVRWPIEEIPVDALTHPLHWYARKKKSGTRLSQIAARKS